MHKGKFSRRIHIHIIKKRNGDVQKNKTRYVRSMNVINSFLKTYLKNLDSNSSLINSDNSTKLYFDNFPFIVYLFIS